MDERVDPLTRRPAVIVGARQDRPNLPSHGCPFCPGGREAPEPYSVRWFPNRWPAMPDGRCEVVLYTPDHEAEFWTLGTDGARRVVDLWTDRTRELGARPDVDYVLVFENRGERVGATIPHPHGQIYAFDHVPPEPLRELVDGVLEPDRVPAELAVSAAGRWRAWVPAAATYPYEMVLADDGAGSLSDDGADPDGLAALMVDVLARLDQLFDAPMPYMWWLHQRPTDDGDWPGAVLHLHLVPIDRARGVQRYVAGAELGSGVYFNPVDPADAAAALRSCTGAPPDEG